MHEQKETMKISQIYVSSKKQFLLSTMLTLCVYETLLSTYGLKLYIEMQKQFVGPGASSPNKNSAASSRTAARLSER